MILYLVGVNATLKEELAQRFDVVKLIESMNEVEHTDSEPKALIVSDQTVSYEDLSSIKTKEFKHVFYLLSNSYSKAKEKNISNICSLSDITLIPSRLVDMQIAERVLEHVNPNEEKESNVVSFFSVGQNLGVTTVTLNVAKYLSEHTDSKVGVLLLNAWDSGESFLPNFKGNFLNEVKGKLEKELLNKDEEFSSIFHQYDENLYVLGGNKNIRLERLYSKDEINYLLKRSQEYFDIVLVDSGSHFDNAVMVQTLEESRFRYLITNQQPKYVNKWQNLLDTVLQPLGYTKDEFLLLINQFQSRGQLRSASDVAKDYEIMLLTTVPFSNYGILSEDDKKFLCEFEDEGFNEAIEHISKAIGRETNLNFKETERKKKFFF
jgi:Flp pilus assembly CpaE family ATPase